MKITTKQIDEIINKVIKQDLIVIIENSSHVTIIKCMLDDLGIYSSKDKSRHNLWVKFKGVECDIDYKNVGDITIYQKSIFNRLEDFRNMQLQADLNRTLYWLLRDEE